MATTMMAGGTTGAGDLFVDFERGVYEMVIDGWSLTESTIYKNQDGSAKEQVEVAVTLPDVDDPQSGKALTRKVWLTAIILPPNPDSKSPRGRKGSQLWQLIRAASGVACQDGVEYDLDDLLVGRRVTAYVALNEKGYPRVDNDTFESIKGPKLARAATPPPAPAPVAPPPAPAAPAGDALTDKTRQRIAKLAAAEGFNDDVLALHCAEVLGATWPDLTEAQGKQLTEALLAGEVAPF